MNIAWGYVGGYPNLPKTAAQSRSQRVLSRMHPPVPQNVTTGRSSMRIKFIPQPPCNLWEHIRMLNCEEEDWDSEEWKMNFFTSISIFTIGSSNGAVLPLLISLALR